MAERVAESRRVRGDEQVLDERYASPGLLLALLGQEAMRRLRVAHVEAGISPRQFHLLGLLHDRGALSQAELGQTMGLDKSVMVSLLNPLEADLFITRQRDPADRRRHLVSLTTVGRRELEKAARAQRDAEAALFAGVGPDALRGLSAGLIALRDALAAAGCTTNAAEAG